MINEVNGDKFKLVPYKCKLGLKNKLQRLCWNIVSLILFKPFRLRQFNFWRLILLRCFGAKIGKKCVIHASVIIWAPWNLEMGDLVCLGPHVNCYNVDKVVMGSKITVSQYSYLCTASHDITNLDLPLTTQPIIINNYSWVCAGVFISPGVSIGEGSICAARAVVTKDVSDWIVVGGNPAKFLKNRQLKEN